ncbi:DUF2378 family protein [Archangium violaceum]|uniref:TIGR02265 family protein n=1 Tax=Archangium violaceum TaxID=83451 RepID=UPI00193B0770|nr:TIGR02265 family protein [Archangium violaceum]QRK12764.1 DUF2378 family protein [Archangium violaceum]
MEAGATRDWARELHESSLLATPQDTVRGLFFTSMLDSIRGLGNEVAVARCQEALEGHTFVPFFSYPTPLLVRLTGVAMRELSGQYGGPENAVRALGRKATADFMASAVGNTVRLVAGKDIKLLTGSVQTLYRMTSSYGERRLEWPGEKSGRLIMRRTFLPVPYHEGVVEGLVTQYGARNVRVRGRQTAPLDSVYDFSWE